MKNSHHDPIAYYKKLESEINKSIHAAANNRSFTAAFGKALEVHLKRLRIHKRLTTRWINRLGFANKDELAAISVKLTECVEKLDLQDDLVFSIKKLQQQNHTRIKALENNYQEILISLIEEMAEIQRSTITELEKDLLELKQFFQNEVKEG